MKYKEIIPGEQLRPYVKCYFIFESDTTTEFEDIVFPGGYMEFIFNLGEGEWKSGVDDKFYTTPQIELWGQITKPLAVKSKGRHTMLGIRFFAHSAAYFLREAAWEFNDQVSDLKNLLGPAVRTLHEKLLDIPALDKRIEFIEHFLISRLDAADKRFDKLQVIGKVLDEMKKNSFSEDIETIATRYGMTSRYLQKLFLQYTGLTPKLYSKINRFQHSLALIKKSNQSLTAIAYECGYFDQSHFIRDFKSFTGFIPSAYTVGNYPINQAFASPQ